MTGEWLRFRAKYQYDNTTIAFNEQGVFVNQDLRFGLPAPSVINEALFNSRCAPFAQSPWSTAMIVTFNESKAVRMRLGLVDEATRVAAYMRSLTPEDYNGMSDDEVRDSTLHRLLPLGTAGAVLSLWALGAIPYDCGVDDKMASFVDAFIPLSHASSVVQAAQISKAVLNIGAQGGVRVSSSKNLIRFAEVLTDAATGGVAPIR